MLSTSSSSTSPRGVLTCTASQGIPSPPSLTTAVRNTDHGTEGPRSSFGIAENLSTSDRYRSRSPYPAEAGRRDQESSLAAQTARRSQRFEEHRDVVLPHLHHKPEQRRLKPLPESERVIRERYLQDVPPQAHLLPYETSKSSVDSSLRLRPQLNHHGSSILAAQSASTRNAHDHPSVYGRGAPFHSLPHHCNTRSLTPPAMNYPHQSIYSLPQTHSYRASPSSYSSGAGTPQAHFYPTPHLDPMGIGISKERVSGPDSYFASPNPPPKSSTLSSPSSSANNFLSKSKKSQVTLEQQTNLLQQEQYDLNASRPPAPSPPSSMPIGQYPLHFRYGSQIQLSNGDLKRVEDLSTDDFVKSAEKNGEVQISNSIVTALESNPTTGVAKITFSVGKTKVTVESDVEHPFFVVNQGWSSPDPDRTLARYQLQCQQLKLGDSCISLTHIKEDQKVLDARKALEGSNEERKVMPPPRNKRPLNLQENPTASTMALKKISSENLNQNTSLKQHVESSGGEKRQKVSDSVKTESPDIRETT